MTSRACDGEEWEGAEGRGRGRWKVSSESEEGGTYRNGKPGQRIVERGCKRWGCRRERCRESEDGTRRDLPQ